MNKKIILLLSVIVMSFSAKAQEEADALRYSELTNGGTARVRAIGGAMGSLGGDISALHVNPAGIGLYKTNEFVITPGYLSLNNKSNYLGNTNTDSKGSFLLGGTGLIFATNNRKGPQAKWKNFTIGLGIDRLANFNSNLSLSGQNDNSSYIEKYIEELAPSNGPVVQANDALNNTNSYDPYGASLALATYLLDPIFKNNNPNEATTGYSSVIFNAPGVIQESTVKTTGGTDEYSFGVAGNYNDQLYIGGSINIPVIDYNRTTVFAETDASNDNNNSFGSFQETQHLKTEGWGINGKLGLIYSPAPAVRVGLAYHTPTAYTMHDTYSTDMAANTENYQGMVQYSTQDLTNGYPGDYDYKLTTPGREIVSLSYLVNPISNVKKQAGFITADYEHVNYGASHFNFNSSNSTASDKALADNLNQSIDTMYKSASIVRVGGELKFDVFMVRAGFAWYSSPYQRTDFDGSQKQYSAGLGYRNHGFFLDLTYVYTQVNDDYYPYKLNDKASPLDKINKKASTVLLTLGTKF